MGPPSSGGIDRRRGAQHPRRLRPRGRTRARRSCTGTSRPRGTRSPTATPTSPTRRSSTCRSRASISTRSRPSGAALITDRAANSPVPAGRPVRQPGRRRPGRRRASATISHRGSRPRTSRSPTARATTVSYTFTIESTGGNGIVVPGYGFLLNNELTDFNYRLHDAPEPRRTAASARAARWRRRSSSRAASRVLAIGSPGGSTIPGTVLQTLVNRIDLGSRSRTRSRSPRAVERNTASTQAEQSFIDSPEGQDLRALGYKFITPDDTARSAPRRDRRDDGDRVPRRAASSSPRPSRSAAAPAPRRRRPAGGAPTAACGGAQIRGQTLYGSGMK